MLKTLITRAGIVRAGCTEIKTSSVSLVRTSSRGYVVSVMYVKKNDGSMRRGRITARVSIAVKGGEDNGCRRTHGGYAV